MRGGTLDAGHTATGEPDVFVYTATKVSWVVLLEEKRVFDKGYERKDEWSEKALRPRIEEWKAGRAREN